MPVVLTPSHLARVRLPISKRRSREKNDSASFVQALWRDGVDNARLPKSRLWARIPLALQENLRGLTRSRAAPIVRAYAWAAEITMGKYWEFRNAFPLVEMAIEQLCQQTGEAEHKAIVVELLSRQQPSDLIELAVRRCRQKHTREKIASNMVAWLSQQYTRGRLSDFSARFRRRKRGGNWAYSYRGAPGFATGERAT
jgi:hypothetical protein